MNLLHKKFYNLFWTDSTCQDIFSIHKSQLLENEVELIVTTEKFYAQRLVLTNSQLRKIETQITRRTENENIELIHNLQTSAKKYFDETQMEIFFNQKFGRTIKKVEDDLSKNGGWFKMLFKLVGSLNDEKDIFKLLSDYYLIPQNIENMEDFGKYCETQFKNNLKEFIKKENLSDLAISIDLVSTYYNYKIKNNLFGATKHYTDVLYDTENYKDRLSFFDELYEMSVITGGKLKGYYECNICPPNTYNGIITSNIKPSKHKMKCPSCAKELLYIVPYELDELIHKHIIHKDGLLFFAIQYLLEQNKIQFSINQTFLSDVEIDICLTNSLNKTYEIIEVKMFKTDRPEDTQVGNLREAVGQMKRAIDKLTENVDLGYKNISHSIVTNMVKDSIYKQAKKELETDLIEYNIAIYSIHDFYAKIANKN